MAYNPYNAPGGGYALWIGLAATVALLLWRNRKPVPLKIERLWIRPVIFLVLLAFVVGAMPPPLTVLSVAILAVALIVGAALGWQRARFTRIEVHPETHALSTRMSPLGLVFIVALVAIRSFLRGAEGEAAGAHLPATAITDALMLFGGGLVIAGSLEIWLRARKLLAEARAAHSDATIVSGDS